MSSVGELTIFTGSLFHELESLTEKAAFLRSKRKLPVAQLEVVSSKVSFRSSLNEFCMRRVKATVEYVVGQVDGLYVSYMLTEFALVVILLFVVVFGESRTRK